MRPAIVADKGYISASFSPVAGIQWVETRIAGKVAYRSARVSVPLPGFSGLRHKAKKELILLMRVSVPLPGFSGLRLESLDRFSRKERSFSPVAGIQWVETKRSILWWNKV